MVPLRFVVIADTHIRHPHDEVDAYPSNALMKERSEFVVGLCNNLAAEFVVHLGDIVHPLPIDSEAHLDAVRLATGVFAGLRLPIHFVPGNHDIGDKPDALVAVPPVAEEYYPVFEHHWGPPYGSFDMAGCHFVIVDTPVIGSGLARDEAQRSWLESDLRIAAETGKRIFLFTHYPPFIKDRTEADHYDNVSEPGRTWLLDLIESRHVEAVFSGHVHNFLYNHHRGTVMYVAPATGFVRPDYSELAAVAPESENGREDPAKLGVFVVDVTPEGHVVHPVRTFGETGETGAVPVPAVVSPGWQSPVGVTIRHSWMSTVDFPTEGLDETRRKSVRNDALIPALWEARIGAIRIPVGDVLATDGRQRVRHLAGRGSRFSIRSGGIPDAATREAIWALGGVIDRWEIDTPAESFSGLLEALAVHRPPAGLRLAVGPIVPIGEAGSGVHHFVAVGFSPFEDGWRDLVAEDTGGLIDELIFRIPHGVEVVDAVALLAAADTGRGVVAVVDLPRASESCVFADDDAVADRVGEAVAAALAHPGVPVFLDGFQDHDRGYYPRHGLVDRHHNPRAALYRLIEIASAGSI
ncbi:metallophosphoesterase [bacterium]|nr:metallophosphoesterase [bacterium]